MDCKSEGISQEVALELLGPCNYLCWYCVGHKTTTRFPEPVLHDLPKLAGIYSSLKGRGSVKTSFYARGSEPALHSQVREVVTICAAAGPVTILTNLSIPVGEWLSDSHNCTLRVTIHPEAEEDIRGFIVRVEGAKNLGYNMLVAFDASRIEETDYRERLLALDIGLLPLRLRVPLPTKGSAPHVLRAAYTACTAGYDRFFIRATTILCRCTHNLRSLPAPLPGPRGCPDSASCRRWKEAKCS